MNTLDKRRKLVNYPELSIKFPVVVKLCFVLFFFFFVSNFRLVHPYLPVILEVNISLAWQDLEQQLGLAWEHLNLM